MKKWVMLAWALALMGNGLASDDELEDRGSWQLVNYAGVGIPSDGIAVEDGERFRRRSQAPVPGGVYVWGNFGGVERRGELVDIGQVFDKIMGMGARGGAGEGHSQVRELDGPADDDNPFVKGEEVQASDFDLPGVFAEDEHNWYGRDPRHPGTYYTQAKIKGFGRITRDDPEARREGRGANGGGIEEVVEVPRQSAKGPCHKSYRTYVYSASLSRIMLPLALATAGTILMEVVKSQPLTPNPSYLWLGELRHEKFFFPTALFNTASIIKTGTVGRMLDFAYTYWDSASNTFKVGVLKGVIEGLNVSLLWLPPIIGSVAECVKTRCWRRSGHVEDVDIPAVKFRLISKALGMGMVAAGGGAWLIYNVGAWSWIFSYRTPMMLQQMNVSSAIELCKSIPSTGMAWLLAINDTYQSLCDPSALADYAVPTTSGLVWSYCERAITSVSGGNYAMLIMPFVFILVEWLYLVWWL